MEPWRNECYDLRNVRDDDGRALEAIEERVGIRDRLTGWGRTVAVAERCPTT